MQAIVSELRAAVDADAGVAVYLDDGEGALRLAFADGPAGERFESRITRRAHLVGRSFVPAITEEPPGAALLVAVPDVGGGFVYMARHRPRQFTREERAVARVVARRLAGRVVAYESERRTTLRVRQLETIQRIGASLTRLATVEEVGQTIAAEIGQVIDFRECRVYVVGNGDGRLEPVAVRREPGSPVPWAADELGCRVGEGLAGLVAAHGKPLVVPDVARDGRASRIEARPGIDESMLLMPLVFERRVGGVIVLFKRGVDQFGPDDERMLSILADQAAVAMENARLLESRDQYVAELRALLDLSSAGSERRETGVLASLLAVKMAVALGLETGSILHWVDGTSRLHTLGMHGSAMRRGSFDLLEHPLFRKVLRERIPLVLQADDPESSREEAPRMRERGDRTLLLLPLVAGGTVIGLAELAMRSRTRAFTPSELDYCLTLANHAAAVLENAMLLDRLKRAADVDQLTGLANHRRLQERLAQEVARASRTGQPLGVALLDLDGFKLINDRHGHAAGDQVLHELAATLRLSVRTNDVVARYGGDEFVVLMPDTTARDARVTAQRLLAALAERSFRLADGSDVAVGASIGLAIYPDDGVTPGELLAASDRAMYTAKRRGGGGVRQAHGRGEPRNREPAGAGHGEEGKHEGRQPARE